MTGFGDGWASKSADSVDGRSVDSGRRDRATEAVRLVRREPLVGVGPGRYVIALEDVEHTELRPAHDLPLHVAANRASSPAWPPRSRWRSSPCTACGSAPGA